MLEKRIVLNNQLSSIDIEYSDNDTYFGDTAIKIYDSYKASIILTEGTAVVIGNKILYPKCGDVVILRPDEVHFGRFPLRDNYAFISFMIPTNFFDTIFIGSQSIMSPFMDKSNDRINLISPGDTDRSRLVLIAENLLSMMRKNDACFDIKAFSMFVELLDICNRCCLHSEFDDFSDRLTPIVKKALVAIDGFFPEFYGLDELARHCGCSVTYLTQAFKKCTGKTIYNYLTERRLENARILLKTGKSVMESAEESGYYDTSRFITHFKKYFGVTPGKYKKECANIKITSI